MTKSLLDFFAVPQQQEKKQTPYTQLPPIIENKVKEVEEIIYPNFPEDLPPSYLVSAFYDGKKQVVILKLYEPKSKKIYFWEDNTGHKPYCLTSLPPEELQKLKRVINHSSFDHFEIAEKFNPLMNKKIKVTKVVAKDPLAIGGRQSGCMRDIIPLDYQELTGIQEPPKVWESYIRYYQSYFYDNNLALGMLYRIHKKELIPVNQKME